MNNQELQNETQRCKDRLTEIEKLYESGELSEEQARIQFDEIVESTKQIEAEIKKTTFSSHFGQILIKKNKVPKNGFRNKKK